MRSSAKTPVQSLALFQIETTFWISESMVGAVVIFTLAPAGWQIN